MQKTSATLIAAMLLTSTMAFAAAPAMKTGEPMAQTGAQASAPADDTLSAKTKRGAHKMGDAMRRAGHNVAAAGHRMMHPNEAREAAAPTSDTVDAPREQRMNDAYADWQKKSKS
jgi:hypothetical protein